MTPRSALDLDRITGNIQTYLRNYQLPPPAPPIIALVPNEKYPGECDRVPLMDTRIKVMGCKILIESTGDEGIDHVNLCAFRQLFHK